MPIPETALISLVRAWKYEFPAPLSPRPLKPEPGETPGARESKSSKRLAGADPVIYEYFPLPSFSGQFIQKAIRVDVEKTSSWIWPLSDWFYGVWFHEE